MELHKYTDCKGSVQLTKSNVGSHEWPCNHWDDSIRSNSSESKLSGQFIRQRWLSLSLCSNRIHSNIYILEVNKR